MRLIRAKSCSGLSATTIWIVEQLGLAMIPRCFMMSCGLTSGTTSGTSGSMRNALELSTTTAPAAAATGLHSRETAAGVLDRTMSTSENSDRAESSRIKWVFAAKDNRMARAPGRRQEFDGSHRKGAFLEEADHPLSNRTTGTDDRDVLHYRLLSSSEPANSALSCGSGTSRAPNRGEGSPPRPVPDRSRSKIRIAIWKIQAGRARIARGIPNCPAAGRVYTMEPRSPWASRDDFFE